MSSFQFIKHACCLKFQIANVHKTNNKKQPPEVFYKKLFLKVCQHSLETTVLESFFTQNKMLQFWGGIKRKFRRRCFSLNITKLLKTLLWLTYLWTTASEYCKARLFIRENCKIVVKCFSTFAGKYLYQSIFFNKYKCSLELKTIFIKKEAPAQVFSWQLSEIFNNNFFNPS